MKKTYTNDEMIANFKKMKDRERKYLLRYRTKVKLMNDLCKQKNIIITKDMIDNELKKSK
jgi:hypothetical protein